MTPFFIYKLVNNFLVFFCKNSFCLIFNLLWRCGDTDILMGIIEVCCWHQSIYTYIRSQYCVIIDFLYPIISPSLIPTVEHTDKRKSLFTLTKNSRRFWHWTERTAARLQRNFCFLTYTEHRQKRNSQTAYIDMCIPHYLFFLHCKNRKPASDF